MPIINNLAGYGAGSGKVDEFGLPIFEPTTGKLDRYNSDFHQSREFILEPLTFAFPQGAAGFFAISNGQSLEQPLPTANFYDIQKSPIEKGWKRGLYVIAPQLAVCGASIMLRKPVAGYVLRFTLADVDCKNPIWSADIKGDVDCGRNMVWEFPSVVLDGQYVMWVEVLEAPKNPSCCPLIVSTRIVVKDYCHEAYANLSIPCTDCDDCSEVDVPKGTHPVQKK